MYDCIVYVACKLVFIYYSISSILYQLQVHVYYAIICFAILIFLFGGLFSLKFCIYAIIVVYT